MGESFGYPGGVNIRATTAKLQKPSIISLVCLRNSKQCDWNSADLGDEVRERWWKNQVLKGRHIGHCKVVLLNMVGSHWGVWNGSKAI